MSQNAWLCKIEQSPLSEFDWACSSRVEDQTDVYGSVVRSSKSVEDSIIVHKAFVSFFSDVSWANYNVSSFLSLLFKAMCSEAHHRSLS